MICNLQHIMIRNLGYMTKSSPPSDSTDAHGRQISLISLTYPLIVLSWFKKQTEIN